MTRQTEIPPPSPSVACQTTMQSSDESTHHICPVTKKSDSGAGGPGYVTIRAECGQKEDAVHKIELLDAVKTIVEETWGEDLTTERLVFFQRCHTFVKSAANKQAVVAHRFETAELPFPSTIRRHKDLLRKARDKEGAMSPTSKAVQKRDLALRGSRIPTQEFQHQAGDSIGKHAIIVDDSSDSKDADSVGDIGDVKDGLGL
ncbi:hypothetical protein KEM56_003777 [Ascosphaera pollenicola]|nr:hypothetical protein KEM56_003777 [Ascosphaera pollenicola]